ncbi:MAG: hypothetical protein MJ252_24700 [archaeon]|nr:hypothetical protein [archaeon]
MQNLKELYSKNIELEESLEKEKRKASKAFTPEEPIYLHTEELNYSYGSPLKTEEDPKCKPIIPRTVSSGGFESESPGQRLNENLCTPGGISDFDYKQTNSKEISENLNSESKTNELNMMDSYEKLKEDYCNALIEKQNLEMNLQNINRIKEEKENIQRENEHLKNEIEYSQEKLRIMEKDNASLKQQIENISSLKDDLTKEILYLREKNKVTETEKTQIKINNRYNASKFESQKKEIEKLSKVNANRLENINELKKKLIKNEEEKHIMKQNLECQIQKLENKIIVLEQENNKFKKEKMNAATDDLINSHSDYDLYFIPMSNKIQIKKGDKLISEVKNCGEFRIPTKTSASKRDLDDSYAKSPDTGNFSLKKTFNLGGLSESSKKSFGICENKENISTNMLALDQIPEEYNSPVNTVQIKKISNFEDKEFSLDNCINKINLKEVQNENYLLKKKFNILEIESNAVEFKVEEESLKNKTNAELTIENGNDIFYLKEEKTVSSINQIAYDHSQEASEEVPHYNSFIIGKSLTNPEFSEDAEDIGEDHSGQEKLIPVKKRNGCFTCCIF